MELSKRICIYIYIFNKKNISSFPDIEFAIEKFTFSLQIDVTKENDVVLKQNEFIKFQ